MASEDEEFGQRNWSLELVAALSRLWNEIRRAHPEVPEVVIVLWPNRGRLVIGLYKTELIRRQGPWRVIEKVEWQTLAWVEWFNNRRIVGPLGYVSPAEHEAAYYRRHASPAMVAGLK